MGLDAIFAIEYSSYESALRKFAMMLGVTATYQYRTYRAPYILQFTECSGDDYNPYCNIEILEGLPSLR